MSEIATTQSAPANADLRFVAEVHQAATVLAQSDMVPQAYRNKPANIVLAAGLGRGMGLDVFQSMQRITVIQGTPTASAELIASNVRKAGHRLEVQVDEKAKTATCTITRADDGTVTTVTRDMTWAQGMGLASKDNYKKQPTTMLSWRAITACARLACSEALYGVAYTADEIETVPATVVRSASDYDTPPPAAVEASPESPFDAEVVEESGEAITDPTLAKVLTLASGPAQVSEIIGRPVVDPGDLTEAEGRRVVTTLSAS